MITARLNPPAIFTRKYTLGDCLPLRIVTVNANYVPTMPTTAPTAKIYDLSTNNKVGATISLPIIDRYARETGGTTNCLFGTRHKIGSDFTEATTYAVLYEWAISGTTRAWVEHFQLDGNSGDADGSVIAVEHFPRPESDYVQYDTESGKTLRGRNPH